MGQLLISGCNIEGLDKNNKNLFSGIEHPYADRYHWENIIYFENEVIVEMRNDLFCGVLKMKLKITNVFNRAFSI